MLELAAHDDGNCSRLPLAADGPCRLTEYTGLGSSASKITRVTRALPSDPGKQPHMVRFLGQNAMTPRIQINKSCLIWDIKYAQNNNELLWVIWIPGTR